MKRVFKSIFSAIHFLGDTMMSFVLGVFYIVFFGLYFPFLKKKQLSSWQKASQYNTQDKHLPF